MAAKVERTWQERVPIVEAWEQRSDRTYRQLGRELRVSRSSAQLLWWRYCRERESREMLAAQGLDTPVDYSGLPTRVCNVLRWDLRVQTIREIARVERAALLLSPNIGVRSVETLETFLAAHGLQLKG
jgi:hypothetical protein